MSDSTLARRTEIAVKIDGVDISADMNQYLLSLIYTDHEEDKTDDLQISLDDREGVWITSWLGVSDSDTPPTSTASGGDWNVGDIVQFTGTTHYTNANAAAGKATKPGRAMVTQIYNGKHPYHLRAVNDSNGYVYGVYGWVDTSDIAPISATTGQTASRGATFGAKGAEISAVILQKNWESDGKDRVLDCGVFEIDALDASGPPAQVSIKATSLPYSSTVRTQTKTRAWERIKLSAIAGEIARKNGMMCMFESAYDPLYERREQVQVSDIVFLQGLCKAAGIALKVTARCIVLFDATDYEKKAAVREIRRGAADVKPYRFGTSTNDVAYKDCHVSYTDPQTGKTIEYTYTPRDADKNGQTLEINEKVKTREEARQLAMKRLRQKNKAEYSAEFTLVGDVRLVAGVTVSVVGWGMFDGRFGGENP